MGIPMVVEKYGKEVFDIHDSYINAIIPFNKKVLDTMNQNGKNDGKNLVDDLNNNEKRILLKLISNPSISYNTLVSEFNIFIRTVSRVFNSLVDKCYIERIGTNKKYIGKY